MAKYEIIGGTPLKGEVVISGAKNAVVAILPATLLVPGKCRIENVPNISDVRILLEIMRSMAMLLPQDGASFNSLLEYDITEGMSDTEIVIFCFVMGEETLTRVAALEQMGNSVKVVLLTAEDLYEGGA